jgi:DNA-directed RNA polymerase specialized sigma24 family protein
MFHGSGQPADVLGHAGVPSARFTSKPRCMAVHAAMNERRDHYLAPATDDDTESVLDEAIDSLARLRAMGGRGNAGVDLHLLTSLIDEATRRLSGAVARARGQDYSWAEIADLLGVTRASAWQRYAGRTDDDPTPVEDRP